MITKTKIKEIALMTIIGAFSVATLGGAYAATDIGDVTVTGSGAMTQNIIWDDTFPGTATGTVSGIIVTASIEPSLNMSISTGSIALGVLSSGIESTGSLNLEIGTNAVSGVKITARSGSGGLTNTSSGSIQINDLVADGNAESYQFSSTHTVDSTVVGFTSTGDLTALEVNDNLTEHQIYLTNKPEITDGSDDVTFTVGATSNAQSAAGNYQDEITFTVVGNF